MVFNDTDGVYTYSFEAEKKVRYSLQYNLGCHTAGGGVLAQFFSPIIFKRNVCV